eukprot:12017068-Alexandrium_andersonii.AAC.1
MPANACNICEERSAQAHAHMHSLQQASMRDARSSSPEAARGSDREKRGHEHECSLTLSYARAFGGRDDPETLPFSDHWEIATVTKDLDNPTE